MSELFYESDFDQARCRRCGFVVFRPTRDATMQAHADYHAQKDRVEAERGLFIAMHTLARNLRDAAGCAVASDLRNLTIGEFGDDIESAWHSNCDGKPAPGWER